MEIIKIDFKNPEPEIIKKAILVIKRGGILVYPTDTCYGLGVDPENKMALQKLLNLKGRLISKKMSVIVHDFSVLKKICQVNQKQEEILKKYLPGPFTFVLKTKIGETLGVRIPDYLFTKILSKELNSAYTTTSANLSGQKECYDVTCVLKQFKNREYQPDLVLDGGELPKNPPSTVVDLTSQPPKILRRGRGKFQE